MFNIIKYILSQTNIEKSLNCQYSLIGLFSDSLNIYFIFNYLSNIEILFEKFCLFNHFCVQY